MTNTIALFLGILIAIGIGLDLGLNDGAALFFLAQKFLALIDWVEFWR